MSDPNEKLDQILAETIRIRTALWPDEGQPGVLTQHDQRLDRLESWRNWLTGIGSAISIAFGFHIGGGKH